MHNNRNIELGTLNSEHWTRTLNSEQWTRNIELRSMNSESTFRIQISLENIHQVWSVSEKDPPTPVVCLIKPSTKSLLLSAMWTVSTKQIYLFSFTNYPSCFERLVHCTNPINSTLTGRLNLDGVSEKGSMSHQHKIGYISRQGRVWDKAVDQAREILYDANQCPKSVHCWWTTSVSPSALKKCNIGSLLCTCCALNLDIGSHHTVCMW